MRNSEGLAEVAGLAGLAEAAELGESAGLAEAAGELQQPERVHAGSSGRSAEQYLEVYNCWRWR